MTLTQTPEPKSPPAAPFLEQAMRIRVFERKLLELFREGRLAGTVHTCIGQEFCATALHPHLRKGTDAFFATHRGHGHYLAYGGPEDKLLAELMGREGALCLGRGGTQNLCYQRFFSAGIQGGSAPIATGYAWALRRRGENAIVVAQIGDGTLGEGTLYEAFTFAALLRAPVLFLLEYNGWAQSTDVRTTTPGNLLQRAVGFGLEADWIKDEDPVLLYEHLGKVVAKVRQGVPFLQVIETRRLMAHSKGDDNRSPEYLDNLRQTDPLARLLAADRSLQKAEKSAEKAVDQVSRAVWDSPPLEYAECSAIPVTSVVLSSMLFHADIPGTNAPGRVIDELNAALHDILANHEEVLLIGEDLSDPYGGAFKVTRGLSSKFPRQVLSTPIAEAGIIGLSNGMALAGLRPVAELMFGDFATLVADQLINFAAKFHYMYAGKVTCPITVRLVSGAGRGYGPTHSQSLERLFCGIPGLRVLALSQRHAPDQLLRHAVLNDDSPKVFVENKLLYALRPADKPPLDLQVVPGEKAGGDYPPLRYAPPGGRTPDVTMVTYGGMTGVAEAAMQRLVEDEELHFDYVVLTQLWPLDVTEIVASVARSRRLVVLEENVADFGVAAAVIANVAQRLPGCAAYRAVGCLPVPIPCVRHLEDQVLASANRVVTAVRETL